MWVKTHTSHSSGVNNETYHYFRNKKEYQDFREEYIHKMDREYDWSEHYHGVVFKTVVKPSQEWLQKQIKRIEREIEGNDDWLKNKYEQRDFLKSLLVDLTPKEAKYIRRRTTVRAQEVDDDEDVV